MIQSIRDIMLADPICLPARTSATAAAMAMRDAGIGDVIVLDDGQVCGIVTDRDIVARAVAEHLSADEGLWVRSAAGISPPLSPAARSTTPCSS